MFRVPPSSSVSSAPSFAAYTGTVTTPVIPAGIAMTTSPAANAAGGAGVLLPTIGDIDDTEPISSPLFILSSSLNEPSVMIIRQAPTPGRIHNTSHVRGSPSPLRRTTRVAAHMARVVEDRKSTR